MKYNFYAMLLIILGVSILVSGLTIFWKGHHNVDLGHNLMYRNCETGDYNWVDEGSDGKTRSGRELYLMGLNYYEKSLLFMLPAMLLIGLGVGLGIRE